jgi:hypothetical protein
MIEDSEAQLLNRITVNPEIFGGKPIIRGGAWRWSISWVCWQLVTALRLCFRDIPG